MIQIAAKKLIMGIIPKFGLPISLGSNNGLAFITKFSQLLSKALNINWKLCCICHPPSSGKVERINKTLKDIFTKCTLEAGGNWVGLLPYALPPVRCNPYQEKFTPYEIVNGQPPSMIPRAHGYVLDCCQMAPTPISQFIKDCN